MKYSNTAIHAAIHFILSRVSRKFPVPVAEAFLPVIPTFYHIFARLLDSVLLVVVRLSNILCHISRRIPPPTPTLCAILTPGVSPSTTADILLVNVPLPPQTTKSAILERRNLPRPYSAPRPTAQ